MYKKCLLLAFFLLSASNQALGDAYLELKMDMYDNAAADDWGGSCCDIFCNACDHQFLITIDKADGRTDGIEGSKVGSIYQKWSGYFQDQNKNVFNTDISGVTNPIVQNFQEWPGTVLFKIYVQDDDSGWSGPDKVDAFIQKLELLPQRSKSTAQWTSLTMKGLRSREPTTMYIEYRLYCTENYYGKKCAVNCVAQDSDASGHYTCDPSTGDPVCLPGYKNPSNRCKTRINYCENNDCRNGGTCVPQLGFYNCSCTVGFGGSRCEIPLNIQCKDGFVGPNCDIDVCNFIFCKNNGTCRGGRCRCPAGYSGDYCEQGASCQDRPCLNDATCYDVAYRCECLPNNKGTRCEHTVASNATYDRQTDIFPVVHINPSLEYVFTHKSNARDLLIALIVICGALLLFIIVLIVALCRFKRRAQNAEKDCRLMSQGASRSVSSSSEHKISENNYQSRLYSQSSVFTDVDSSPAVSRNTSVSEAASPYSHLSEYQKAEPPHYDSLGEDDLKNEKAPPPVPVRPKVEKLTDSRGDSMKLDRKSSC